MVYGRYVIVHTYGCSLEEVIRLVNIQFNFDRYISKISKLCYHKP
jgi:hypothetical protein